MCSYPFEKTTKLEEIILDKTIVHSLTLKDFNHSRILMLSMQPKFFLLFIEINQNLN